MMPKNIYKSFLLLVNTKYILSSKPNKQQLKIHSKHFFVTAHQKKRATRVSVTYIPVQVDAHLEVLHTQPKHYYEVFQDIMTLKSCKAMYYRL